ncbi:type II toxin-antitoxin system VapC family toxin [Dyadobacter sp. MSC1_007]|jgi:predicted nucleic acid-binding protein|uniref:type II toxin-antitoxin system VapC family toxin n=1 Tax=Dyadobacter sp. MSC1_007 TaxID=2909264 RepID=UPI00202E3B0A|nr:type II toxin-antitoxin system VapC family toxin [Dyadobacter sp. MSC1_007]
MKHKGIFCDTSFFIRLLDQTDPLHANARGYFKYFMENNYRLVISTIAVAEYCVGGDLQDLPLRNLQTVPFNLDHAKRTSEFARIVFSQKSALKFKERNIIPNDTKLFAQADCETGVDYFISSDRESMKIYQLLRQVDNPKFQFIDLNNPFHETFGLLNIG